MASPHVRARVEDNWGHHSKPAWTHSGGLTPEDPWSPWIQWERGAQPLSKCIGSRPNTLWPRYISSLLNEYLHTRVPPAISWSDGSNQRQPAPALALIGRREDSCYGDQGHARRRRLRPWLSPPIISGCVQHVGVVGYRKLYWMLNWVSFIKFS